MIHALLAILGAQLAGEAVSHALALPVPGPVLGMILMILALRASPRLAGIVSPLATGVLGHMSLLFVPAGVGVVGHFAALGTQGPAILVALVLSTAFSIAVGALVFAGVARLTGDADD